MATSQNNDASAIIPEHERHLIHVELEAPNYDQRTGTKLSTPQKQVYTVAEFNQAKASGVLEGYDVKVLSKPEDYQVNSGVQKAELHTGPLLGQEQTNPGPAGSVATTAGETLLHTTGTLELEGDHVMTKDNVQRAFENAVPDANTAQNTGLESTAANAPAPTGENLTPKQKLQADYKNVVGVEAPSDLTSAQLLQAINDAKGDQQ